MRDIYDALDSDIAAIGGYKRAACALWPTESATDAHVRLLDKLNPKRREVLAPHELARVVELAAAAGAEATASYLSELAALAKHAARNAPGDGLAPFRRPGPIQR